MTLLCEDSIREDSISEILISTKTNDIFIISRQKCFKKNFFFEVAFLQQKYLNNISNDRVTI